MKFTRLTLIAATEFFGKHTQASFDQAVIRLGLEKAIPAGTSISVQKKCALLARYVLEHASDGVEVVEGRMALSDAVVHEAVQLVQKDWNYEHPLQAPFVRALERDGYVLHQDAGAQNYSIRTALPQSIQLPATDDEVHELLKKFGFVTALGHLDQAIKAHARGDWAACNSQLRSFFEALFNAIAEKLNPVIAKQTSANKRTELENLGFFKTSWGEHSNDGKNFINGLFKVLHTQGSHPGLSDEDHSTFRLHIVLVTARTFLRRLDSWPP